MDSSRLRRVIHNLSGVLLDENKEYLLSSRLAPIMREQGFDTYDRLAERIEFQRDEKLLGTVIDAITTQETRFFRDEAVYETLFRTAIRDLLKERDTLKIWSAGCATGQEPYSLAIGFNEYLSQDNCVIDASDISEAALQKARGGFYTEFELKRGVEPHIKSKYFTPRDGGYQLKDSIRSMVRFFRLNLQKKIESVGYDMIFFRNVAIYFDEPMRQRIFREMVQALVPGGVLVVGTAETPLQYEPGLRVVQSGPVRYYIKDK